MARRPMRDARAYRNYIGRLADVPRYFDQQMANMRAGLARGFSVPRAVLDGRDVSIASVAELDDPAQSAFWKPFEKMPASIPESEQAQLRADARKAIADQLLPAFGQLLTFFRQAHAPNAPHHPPPHALPACHPSDRPPLRAYPD